MFPLQSLPLEIQEMVVLFTDDLLLAVMLQMTHVCKKLIRHQRHHAVVSNCPIVHHSDAEMCRVLKQLVLDDCVKQLLFLFKTDIAGLEDILPVLCIEGSFSLMERFHSIVPFTKNFDMADLVFQTAIKTCSVEKIFFVLHRGFVPEEIRNVRSLRMCPETMLKLIPAIPEDVLFTRDALVVAVESDNVEFLETAEGLLSTARHMISTRDLIIAARKGSLNALKWYHQKCLCKRSNYLHCVLDDSVYRAGLQSHNEGVLNWLQNETNCGMTQYGYPSLGYLNYGYGDGGMIWFRR